MSVVPSRSGAYLSSTVPSAKRWKTATFAPRTGAPDFVTTAVSSLATQGDVNRVVDESCGSPEASMVETVYET
jgi:hypothetical protein